MNRDEREQALWHDAYMLAMSQDPDPAESSGWADAAVAEFSKRYPPDPSATPATAPEAVWYDEPPHPGEYHVEGLSRVCWVDEDVVWCPVWDLANERPLIRELPRNGRRVSPITKPQEPTT